MDEELFVLFHFPHLPLLLNLDFFNDPLIILFVSFIATASNTVLEEEKDLMEIILIFFPFD